MQFIGELVGGQSLWAVLAIFCGLVLVGTTFISHTVGAMVILPIVQSVGDHMPGNHSKLLVMGAALMCSGGACCVWGGEKECGAGCHFMCLGGWGCKMSLL
jgi:di/tricarboxylate transporter